MSIRKIVPLLIAAVITMSGLTGPVSAQEDKRLDDPDIVIEVDGLACPFCAYGIEKRLRKIEELDSLSVLLEEGLVHLTVNEGASIPEERLRKAVADAGFEARKIEYLDKDAEPPSES